MKKYEVEDIVKIQRMNDHIEDHFPCDKGEWVQWLISIVDHPKFLIIGNETSYLVASNNIMRPVSDTIGIIFFHSKTPFEENIKIRDWVNEWALECGTRKVRFITKNLEVLKKYGAKEFGIYGGWDI